MVFSRFIWTILATVAAIAATAILLGIYLQKPGYPVTVSVLVALIVAESTFLIHHLVRIRRDLLRLIQALRNEDPTLMFPRDTRDPYLSAIHRGFNEIIGNFRLVRLDREVEHRFFEATVNHIQFGILAFGMEGKVELVNRSFLELFNMEEIRHLDNLDRISNDLPGWLAQLPHGSESLRKVHVGGTPHQLIFLASRFRLMEKDITLVSVDGDAEEPSADPRSPPHIGSEQLQQRIVVEGLGERVGGSVTLVRPDEIDRGHPGIAGPRSARSRSPCSMRRSMAQEAGTRMRATETRASQERCLVRMRVRLTSRVPCAVGISAWRGRSRACADSGTCPR